MSQVPQTPQTPMNTRSRNIQDRDVLIIDAARSPMARCKGGAFRHVRAEELSAQLMRALLARNPRLPVEQLDDVIWGCVNQTLEQGFNIARMAAIRADIPTSVPAQTVSRLCGSSMTALHAATAQVSAGMGEAFLVGGVEHMGHVGMTHGADLNPHMSHHTARASMLMGVTAEGLAQQYRISRQRQDAFALRSHQRASEATQNGRFDDEIIPLEGHDNDGVLARITHDEVIRHDASLEALSGLAPAFVPKVGSVTAGNSSAMSDGAAALLIVSGRFAKAHGLTPIGRVLSAATAGVPAAVMGYGPVPASRMALQRAGLTMGDIGAIELNEAFAAQALTVLQDLELQESVEQRVNLHGGAIALGHPLGCSGARIITTLLNVMQHEQHELGLATMCIGMGQGVATVIERLT